MEKNQIKNLRFIENEEFCSCAIENLYNLAHTLVETDSYFVSDDMRSQFQLAKRDLLDIVDKACGQIRYLRNYKSDIENGENIA